MEDDFDEEELEIVLGIKNKEDILKKVISDKKGLSFLGAISKIFNYENLNELYEKNEDDTNENEMISDFSLKMGINKISNISLKEYENSNFINNIKGDDTLLHDSKINFSNEYVQKLQKDFKKESAEPMKPIQIKSNDTEKPKDYNKDYNNNKYKKNNKKNYNKNDNRKNNQEKDKNNEKNLKENENKNEGKEGGDNKEEKKEDNKEENKEGKQEEANFYEDEDEEGNNNENSYKKNEANNNYYNNKRNYKHDRNKQHKAFRQNFNRKKYK